MMASSVLCLEGMARRELDDFMDSFGAVSRGFRAVASRLYATFDVGITQAKFLRAIGEQTSMSQADLARATGTDAALTGRVLQTLIDRGWVRRKRSEEDRRQYIVELTASGERVRKRVGEIRNRIADRLAAELDDRDRADFDRIAKKLIAALGVIEERDVDVRE